ncbi:MAG: GNAT family N-acetyltransferase [Terriglobia bacterium]
MSDLETERLTLRMFRAGDLDAYAEMCADPEVMRYINDGRTLTREEAWRDIGLILGHWQLRGYGLWAAEERSTRTLVGRIGHWNPEGWPGFEVGWMLGRRHWGRGFATEGARAALRHAFTVLNVPHVISLIYPDNARSIRLADRLGERLEGTAEIAKTRLLVYGVDRRDAVSG